MALHIDTDADGIVLSVKVVPNSSRDALVGLLGAALKIKVARPPESGQANRAVEALLARALGVAPRAVRVVSGMTQPHKRVRIQGVSMQQVLDAFGAPALQFPVHTLSGDAPVPERAKPSDQPAQQLAKLARSDEEWRRILTPQQYRVLRQQGTERAFTGEYTDQEDPGTYQCAACGQELFHSGTKFHSGCGWPSFYAALAGERVTLRPDRSHGMVRTEVTCSRCGSHLGHVFNDAPHQPTGQRYCINSVALSFVPDKKE